MDQLLRPVSLALIAHYQAVVAVDLWIADEVCWKLSLLERIDSINVRNRLARQCGRAKKHLIRGRAGLRTHASV